MANIIQTFPKGTVGGSSYTAGDGIDITSNEISTDNMLPEDMSEILDPLPGATPRNINYSTTEQKVGTWIDGKPLYQKTIVYNTATSGNASPTIGTIPDMDTGFVVDGFYINQNSSFGGVGASYMLTNTGRNSEQVTYTSYVYISTGGAVVVIFGSTTASSKTVVTVRYTKKSD